MKLSLSTLAVALPLLGTAFSASLQMETRNGFCKVITDAKKSKWDEAITLQLYERGEDAKIYSGTKFHQNRLYRFWANIMGSFLTLNVEAADERGELPAATFMVQMQGPKPTAGGPPWYEIEATNNKCGKPIQYHSADVQDVLVNMRLGPA